MWGPRRVAVNGRRCGDAGPPEGTVIAFRRGKFAELRNFQPSIFNFQLSTFNFHLSTDDCQLVRPSASWQMTLRIRSALSTTAMAWRLFRISARAARSDSRSLAAS